MQTQKPFFDDIARMAGGALGALSGLRSEIEALIRQQMERFTSGIDMVSREEFEVVREMAAKARAENEVLSKRLAALEAQSGGAPATPKVKAPRAAKPKAKPAG